VKLDIKVKLLNERNVMFLPVAKWECAITAVFPNSVSQTTKKSAKTDTIGNASRMSYW